MQFCLPPYKLGKILWQPNGTLQCYRAAQVNIKPQHSRARNRRGPNSFTTLSESTFLVDS